MKTSIQNLRDAAAKKRDAAIKAAKAEYSETVQKIGELESRLSGQRRRKGSKRDRIRLVDIIYDNLPTDRPFSFADVVGILEANPNARTYAQSSINMTISRMLKAGDIKRVRFAKTGQEALFALPDVKVECEKTMLSWAKEVDGWREMEPVELMVRMTENGYEMEVPPSDAVRSLERELIRE